MEARGEIRGGRFVSGFVGEQFALPEAIEALRASRRSGDDGALPEVGAYDPLQLTGIILPGKREAPIDRASA
jgi:ATP-dependent Lhr-like helicase